MASRALNDILVAGVGVNIDDDGTNMTLESTGIVVYDEQAADPDTPCFLYGGEA